MRLHMRASREGLWRALAEEHTAHPVTAATAAVAAALQVAIAAAAVTA
jgi:hypothetical protein